MQAKAENKGSFGVGVRGQGVRQVGQIERPRRPIEEGDPTSAEEKRSLAVPVDRCVRSKRLDQVFYRVSEQ